VYQGGISILRTVIFANGEIKNPEVARAAIQKDDVLIAADGGVRNCLALGLIPDLVIGDMDSISPEQKSILENGSTRFITYPREKDQTDLELALIHAAEQNSVEILLLGLLGGRLDQTLANLHLLSRKQWDQIRLVVVEGSDTAYILHDRGLLVIHGEAGDIVSLLPLSPQVTDVSTQNLRWPLHQATLHFGSTLSISNQMTDSKAEIRIQKGTLLIVHRVKAYE
jgi:thiamine pyrophosphokinase